MPEIFAPHRIRATTPNGAATVIERGESKTVGNSLAHDAIRQGGIDMSNLAERPKLKPLTSAETTVPTPKPTQNPPAAKPDLDDMPNATAAEMAGEAEEPVVAPPVPTAAIVSHPGDSDIVAAVIEVVNNNDPTELRSDGMPRSFAISKAASRQVDKEEREIAIELVAKRLGR